MPKLTPWFPANVKPARVGYYQRDYGDHPEVLNKIPDYWDGRRWILCSPDGKRVGLVTDRRSWRGLASPS